MAQSGDRNVPGPFYVDPDCCITCGIPVALAPEFFAKDDTRKFGPCFVKRQPVTDAEFAKFLKVKDNAEVDCIRYRGDNQRWRRKLIKKGYGPECDPEDGRAK